MMQNWPRKPFSADALHMAIKDYLDKHGRDSSHIKEVGEAECHLDH